MAGSRPSTWRPSPVAIVPPTTTGTRWLAGGGPQLLPARSGPRGRGLGGTTTAAGRLMVARASLVHQINDAATATTTATSRGGRDIGLQPGLIHAVGGSVSPRGEAVLGRASGVGGGADGVAQLRRCRTPGAGHNIGPESDAVPEPGSEAASPPHDWAADCWCRVSGDGLAAGALTPGVLVGVPAVFCCRSRCHVACPAICAPSTVPPAVAGMASWHTDAASWSMSRPDRGSPGQRLVDHAPTGQPVPVHQVTATLFGWHGWCDRCGGRTSSRLRGNR